MKTKIIKMMSVVIVIVMVFTLSTSCKRRIDAAKAYTNAVDKLKDSSAIDAELKLLVAVKQGGMETKVETSVKFKASDLETLTNAKDIKDLKDVKFSLDFELPEVFMGTTGSVYMCLYDGIMYLDFMGTKFKTDLEMLEDMSGEMQSEDIPEFDYSIFDGLDLISINDLKINEEKSKDGSTAIEAILPAAKLKEAIGKIFEVFGDYVADQMESMIPTDNYEYSIPDEIYEYFTNEDYDFTYEDGEDYTFDEDFDYGFDKDMIKEALNSINLSDVTINILINKDGYFTNFSLLGNVLVENIGINFEIGLKINNPGGSKVNIEKPADSESYMDYAEMMGSLLPDQA